MSICAAHCSWLFFLQIHQADHFILIQSQDDRSIVMEAGIFAFRVRRKRIKPWGTADPAAALRSWHENPSLFPVYADYNTAKRKKQEKDFRKMRRRFLAAAVFLFQACQLFSTYLSFFRLFPVKRIPANPARETAIRANHRSSRVSSPVLGDASGGVGV